MKAICPYCEKKARFSEIYPDMLICGNKICFFYLKDDVRNFDTEEVDPKSLNIIVGLAPKHKNAFALISLSDELLQRALNEKDDLPARGVKRTAIKISNDKAFFYNYTRKTKEMTYIMCILSIIICALHEL